MTLEEFAARLKENQARAVEYVAELRGSGGDVDAARRLLRSYVGCKYFLYEDEISSDNLIKLGELSTEKLARLQRGGLEYADKSVGCTSVASSVTKKILLVMSLQKALGVRFDPDEVAETATLSNLTELVIKALSQEE